MFSMPQGHGPLSSFPHLFLHFQPRVDGFGGGAHVLDLATGETVAWTYTDGWLAEVLDGGDPDA